MTEQQRCEIIKALAYGLDIKTVAECNDVLEDAVLSLAAECGTEIAAKEAELKEAYPDVF